jgi:hypothetical protein
MAFEQDDGLGARRFRGDRQGDGRQDRRININYFGGRVNVDDAWEASFWCSRFGCTRDELREVVGLMGPSAEAVREYFEQEQLGMYRGAQRESRQAP